jgi:hypothetical protein
MPAPNIPASTRFFRPGTTSVVFCTTIANKAAPTRGEINAGTDLRNEVAEISGFQTTSETVDAPDLGSRFNVKIPGRIAADDSSLTLYESVTGVDARSLLPRDTTGFLLFMDGGDVSGRKMDVFPITVASLAHDRSLEDPGRLIVTFTVTSVPAENVLIPA